ncbi:nuclear transport factor 2 family protein [Streptomyces sp. NPDC093252]|uniref:nuclear transport factor 2 family protein n=1 Tax=Streptomyces sp. NPDC093252 TaxID=3154980 RepID=UPI003421D380
MTEEVRTSAAAAEPSPYELYIGLDTFRETWAGCDSRPGAVVWAAALQAAELCLRLADDALHDRRPAAFAPRRLERYVDLLAEGLALTLDLSRTAPPPPPRTLRHHPGGAPVSPGMKILRALPARHLARLTALFHDPCPPFALGVEEALAAACRAPGVTGPRITPGTPRLDHRRVVRPDRVYALRTSDGPEDHLFSTAHQITECWLRVAHHYLDLAVPAATAGRWESAADSLDDACRAARLASRAGQLLDLMNLADYHPLRVKLRDGSGAQSASAHRFTSAPRRAARPLLDSLTGDRILLQDLLDRPERSLERYRYLCAVKQLSKTVQGFLFSHYLLVLDVLGTHTRGSLGHEVSRLAEHAVRPAVAEIDQAHHDLAMVTNLRYAHTAGSTVLAHETNAGWNPYTPRPVGRPCPPAVMGEQVARYFRYIAERDTEAWVGLFHPRTGQIRDNPGTRPFRGRARLRVFLDATFAAFSEMKPRYRNLRLEHDTARVDWHIDAVSYLGAPLAYQGSETFRFAPDGTILSADAHWHPHTISEHLRPS